MSNPVDPAFVTEALHLIQPAIEEAGRLALAAREDVVKVSYKVDQTPLTSLDHEIEALLVERIRRSYPSHRILAEEGSIGGDDSEFTWVIDPLDGTRAFASGLPIWGTSVGLLRDDRPVLSVYTMPAVNERYWGTAWNASCNAIPLSRPASVDLDDPLVFLAVPSNAHLLYTIDFGRLRSLGSTAAHLTYVARGAAIGALTRRVKLWDLAGVLPILAHTGIELRYLSGTPFYVAELLHGETAREPLVAAHGAIIEDVLKTIRIKP
jgi:myo-inositol-1(or 4)-monophosphatase